MSPQELEAIKRSAYQAVGQAAAVFLMALSAGASIKVAAIAAGIAALAALGFRGVYEGRVDAARAKAGNVIASDIQAPPLVIGVPENVRSIEDYRPHI
jgi:hypothetical protein